MSATNQVITDKARLKLLRARSGDLGHALPAITKMAFGDGGTDSQGVPIAPVSSQTSLTHQVLLKNIEEHTYPSTYTCRYKCTIDGTELIGGKVNEIALVDSEGELVAIKTFTDKNHDAGLEMTFTIDDIL